MSDSTERHKLRKQLLANGYRPLPLLDKGIRIKGWSTATIDEDWLEQYARSGRYANTGIRCDDLIAFDIDVLDEDIADEIETAIETYCGETEYCRVGRWPKRLLLYRLAGDPIRSARSGKFDGHQVELLATSGRQFAAFGIHPGTGKPYKWDGFNPQYHGIEKVPELDGFTAQGMLEQIEQIFRNHGLERDSDGGEIGRTGQVLYDLTDDTPVSIWDDHSITDYNPENAQTWADIKPHLTEKGIFGNIMRENGEMGDSNGIKFQLAKGSGEPIAHDFPRDVTHHEALQAIDLPAFDPNAAPAGNQLDTDRTVLDDILENWVLMSNKAARMLNDPTNEYAIDGLRLFFKSDTMPVTSPSGSTKHVPVLDLWLSDRRTLKAHQAQMRPDHPDEYMFKEGPRTIFNTYRAPNHPSMHNGKGGELDTWNDFMVHLIPNSGERALFLDWLAYKVKNPSARMHGFVMVTKEFGTGRGTLFQIVEKLFGIQYVKSMDYDDLIGHTSQSTYNDYFASSLFVTVGEVFEKTDNKSDWEARKIAYERLKSICEPIARPMHIKRKYGRNTTEMVYASLLVSSNHDDALAIEPGDRRLIVVDNTTTKLIDAADNLYQRIEAWHENPANIGRLYNLLFERGRDRVRYDPFGDPPDTAAKRRMISAGQSDLDHLFDWFLDSCKGDVCVHYQWEMFVRRKQLEGELDLPTGDKLKRGLAAIIHKKATRFDHLGNKQIKIEGKPERPWIIRNFEYWKGNEQHSEIRTEILKNGPIKADVTTLKPE